MGWINGIFKRSEFLCRGNIQGLCSCRGDSIDVDTLELVTSARIYFNKPYIVTSGFRCYQYNEYVQKRSNPGYVEGSSNSMHMHARAVDGYIDEVPVEMLYAWFRDKLSGKGGLGLYPNFVHVDTATGAGRRW